MILSDYLRLVAKMLEKAQAEVDVQEAKRLIKVLIRTSEDCYCDLDGGYRMKDLGPELAKVGVLPPECSNVRVFAAVDAVVEIDYTRYPSPEEWAKIEPIVQKLRYDKAVTDAQKGKNGSSESNSGGL